MGEYRPRIEIPLAKAGCQLCIYEEKKKSLLVIEENEAALNCEPVWQLLEGYSYGYYLTDSQYLLREGDVKGIVSRTKIKDTNAGRITPGIYTGTLTLEIAKESEPEITIDTVDLEILPTKLDIATGEQDPESDYRTNYRIMLEDIASKCTELIMQMNSPVSQRFEPDFERDSITVYQRFSFVKSLILSPDFNDALNLIIYAPAARWKEISELADIRRTRRFGRNSLKQIASGTQRVTYPLNGLADSVPVKILGSRKTETVDIPENRFIKHALEVFLRFCENCHKIFAGNPFHKRAASEAMQLISTIRGYLDTSFFRELSRPETLQLNSPLLQRKSGYREVLNAWILFDLAAKLIWKGGDQVYRAGKRDIAVLYEYWLFFQLYELFTDKFEPDENTRNGRNGHLAVNELIEETADGLGLKLRSGREMSLSGRTRDKTRILSVLFSYNRTYYGDTKYKSGGSSWTAGEGSWTKPLRPDYTLSVWPSILERDEAEEEDMIVHIHFDAKYKLRRFRVEVDVKKEQADDEEESDSGEKQSDSLEKEKTDERKGIYRNADLMKMHAYRDAIRRTGGAYILYPGVGDPSETNSVFTGFHEIIPGLGAFAIRPSRDKTRSGINELSVFIDKVIEHFQDRASQRENLASKGFNIHKSRKESLEKDGTTPDIVNDPMPEYIDRDENKKLIPDETFVLVGYCRNDKRHEWYLSNGKYNFRAEDEKGSLELTNEVTNASYLLLRREGSIFANEIFRITSKGPKVYSKLKLEKMHYPDPGHELYLVIDIEPVNPAEFGNSIWDYSQLARYKEIKNKEKDPHKLPGIPFTVTLTELMRTKVKE